MVRVRSEYVKEQQQKYHLLIQGLGAAMFDKIREIKVYFICTKKMQLDETRAFFIMNTEDLINKVNSYDKIRKYLLKYPFSYENADINISYFNENYDYQPPPFIAFIYSKNGKIFYCQNDPITDIFITYHKETFEEAIQILKEQEKLIENDYAKKMNDWRHYDFLL